MDSSDEVDNKSIDPKVGGLVWVRRRNGSWWPGRIMGLDELPEECLVGATTGTPIKLLGRDDASVWRFFLTEIHYMRWLTLQMALTWATAFLFFVSMWLVIRPRM